MTVIDTLNRLESSDNLLEGDYKKPFGPYQEEAIISLALDHPDLFATVGRFMKPDLFGKLECRFIIAQILNIQEEHDVVPTREWLKSQIINELTENDPYDEILRIVDRPSNPREVPLVKDTLLKWARTQAYGLIYSNEAMDAYHRGDFAALESIINEANRIQDVGDKGLWLFEQLELLFQEDIIDHRTTGFPKLDTVLNNGGPSKKEVVCWMAPTNVGKSLVLCNNVITSLKGSSNGQVGQDVLLVTFELDMIKTAMRCLGAASGINLKEINNHKDYVRNLMRQMQETYKKRVCIYELPPDECSVTHLYALVDSLKRKEGWMPDVVVIDYMDLMVSRNKEYNKDDYTRQKHVASELRGFAKNENVLVFTATQTNRTATDTGSRGRNGESANNAMIDLGQAAESFAKQFSLDYIVSLNQSDAQRVRTPPQLTMYVAKNRNGPKHTRINCEINYDTMAVRERDMISDE